MIGIHVYDYIKQKGRKVMTLGSQFFRKLAMCGYNGGSTWYRKVTTSSTDNVKVTE